VGKAKIKFNTDDLFLEGQHSLTDKQNFLRSPLFPVVATMYNTTDRKIRVGHVVSNQVSTSADPKSTIMSAMITTPEGFMVGKVRYNRGTFDFATVSDGVTDPSSNILISTASANYLRAKLSKTSDHVAASWLRRVADDAIHCVSNVIRSISDIAVDRAYGKSISGRPMIRYDDDTTTFLSNVVMGKTTMLQMPAEMRQVFDKKYDEYTISNNKFEEAIEKVKNFFDQGKWVLINEVNNGVILGAITPDGAISGLDIYKSLNGLPHGGAHNFAPFSLRPKWYPSYDAIPEEYRRELDYGLMMLKVHRNADSTATDPNVHDIWMDIGAAIWGKAVVLPR
jgi:hypothetical protein